MRLEPLTSEGQFPKNPKRTPSFVQNNLANIEFLTKNEQSDFQKSTLNSNTLWLYY